MKLCLFQPIVKAGLAALLLILLAGCEREQQATREGPAARMAPAGMPMVDLQPGLPTERPKIANPYEGQVHAINEGRRLYAWFNCIGCHAGGGGGMGPPLMDDHWIYGSEPAAIFATIMEGRPNGMPSFHGRIPEDDVWKIVAYVRSLSGLGTKLLEGTRSLPLQDEASGNLKQGPKELKQYHKEAADD
ncbi:c-type cytochrome [Methylobacter luteus]|uniref:c-type cytochrome n=1 Tax=Methylobacter luteus TaxID=415 RepID=UPI0004198A87|nr:c-type cytochrome [Methylobacter luteus]